MASRRAGAGAANLTVEKIDADRTDLMVGIDLAASPTSAAIAVRAARLASQPG